MCPSNSRKGEILGVAGLVGAGRTELVSAIFGAYAGSYEAELVLEGKPIKIKTPEQAIKAGLSLVPEDRKRQGIVPMLGVGDNITLATLRITRMPVRSTARPSCRWSTPRSSACA
jgi:D-xylose transport system ATP-binding protein